jgi:hypothetical protein
MINLLFAMRQQTASCKLKAAAEIAPQNLDDRPPNFEQRGIVSGAI